LKTVSAGPLIQSINSAQWPWQPIPIFFGNSNDGQSHHSPLAQLGPLGPVVPLPPRVRQPKPPPATGRSNATLLTSGHQLASHAPPLHLKWHCHPILSCPLPFPLPRFPPPLETAPSIAAGRAPNAGRCSSFPDPSLRRPNQYKTPRGSPNHATPLPLPASLARPHRRAPAATSVHRRRPHSFNAPPTLAHAEDPPELLSLFLNSRRAPTHRSGPEHELR
jgi:hypothetical protein